MKGAKVEKDERNVELRMGDVIGITDLQSGGFIVGEVDDFEADDLLRCNTFKGVARLGRQSRLHVSSKRRNNLLLRQI